MTTAALDALAAEALACTLCAAHLPLGPRPTFRVSVTAKLLIISQAPGTKVHETGIPWNDASGDRLRAWLGMTRAQFSTTSPASPSCRWAYAIPAASPTAATNPRARNAPRCGTSASSA